MRSKKWETYEEVAIHLLDNFASEFGLDRFDGKQKIISYRSGTNWVIDGKGFNDGADSFVIVECRRYTKSKQSQEKVGALAYRIQDTGADRGIIVSPLGLQAGAEKVARAENIISVKLTPESTTQEYVMEFLNKICIGLVGRAKVTDSVHIQLFENGKLVEERKA
jgi:hypothetical protein